MIIELQGIIESSQTGGYNGLPIGDLHFDEKVCKNMHKMYIFSAFFKIFPWGSVKKS